MSCPAAARPFLALLLGVALLTVVPRPADADECLPAPRGPVLLAVSGDITRTTDGKEALFDSALLESLGVVRLDTISPLDSQPARFEGVLLRRLLDAVGAKGNAIDAIALNNYIAEIPVAEADRQDVLVAFRRDGRAIPVREMGPLLILYPRGPDTEAVQVRSVRQLARLVIRDDGQSAGRPAVSTLPPSLAAGVTTATGAAP